MAIVRKKDGFILHFFPTATYADAQAEVQQANRFATDEWPATAKVAMVTIIEEDS